jgi:hypothetical protein
LLSTLDGRIPACSLTDTRDAVYSIGRGRQSREVACLTPMRSSAFIVRRAGDYYLLGRQSLWQRHKTKIFRFLASRGNPRNRKRRQVNKCRRSDTFLAPERAADQLSKYYQKPKR